MRRHYARVVHIVHRGSVLQCVAVCRSVSQCVAVCCSVKFVVMDLGIDESMNKEREHRKRNLRQLKRDLEQGKRDLVN